jgi:hypothetical protein
VEATSAKSVNGEIILDGGDTGLVTVSGALDASGKAAGETGGTVKVLGNQVNLAAGATIDVSGDAGGGTALIGGNFHGAGPEANASVTVISANATINADAISTGNGGKVAVWSEQYTDFYGTITARGGSLGGSGGFVETSSRGILHAFGTVNVGAPYGTAGTWLLDPANVTIEANSGTVTSGTFSSGTFTPGASATDSIIDPSVIETALNSGASVLINANGNTAISAGNILINANLTLSGNHTTSSLTFSAGSSSGSITLGANDTIAVSGNTDTLAINLIAGAAGSIAMATGSAIVVAPPDQAHTPSSINLSFNAGAGSSILLGNGSTIATDGGNVSFNRPVILGSSGTTGTVSIDTTVMQHTTLGGSVDFGSTVDAASAAVVGLTVGGGVGGTVTFGGSVGGTTALTALTLTSAATLTSNAALDAGTLTVGAISAGGHNLTLESDTISLTGGTGSISGTGSLTVEPSSDGADVTLGGTTAGLWLNNTSLSAFAAGFASETFGRSTGTGTLTINTSGTFLTTTTFVEGPSGVVVVTNVLTGGAGVGLTLQAGTVDLNNNVTTSDAPIVIAGGALLTSNATLNSGGGNITVTGTNTINSAAGTAYTLDLEPGAGNVTLAGAIGGTTPLGALFVAGSGTTTLSGGTISTTTAHSASGSISFSEGVLLAGDETMTSAGGNISFAGAINGGFGLLLTAPSGVVSLLNVGATTPLAMLSVDPGGIVLGGSTYHTTGGQTYTADVTLGTNVSVVSDSGSIEFLSGIDGAHALTALAALGSVDLHDAGATIPLSSLAVSGSSIVLSGGTLHSSGGQSFSGPVLVTGNENLLSDAGSVTFASTVEGPQALSVTATSGSIGVGGLIGGSTALAGLALDGKTVALVGIGSTGSDGVTGTVSITGTTAIDLAGSAYHSGGSESFVGPVVLLHDEIMTSDTGAVLFASTVDGAFGLTSAATVTTFDGTVGSGTALTSLTVTHTADLNGGSITTSGAQTYDGPVVLTTNDLLTGTTITFLGTVDGAFGLTATATGLTTFDAAVGSGTPLASLTVTHTADLNGGSITTSGAQTYDGPVVLTTNNLLTGSAVLFASTVDGAFGLTSAATVTTFDGTVGSGTALTSLTVTHAADLNGGTVKTTGAQSYDGPVTLGASATLTSVGSDVTFKNTVDGSDALSVTATSGNIAFDGLIGGTSPLTSLVANATTVTLSGIGTPGSAGVTGAVSITASGLIVANGATDHSGGSESFSGPFLLAGDATLISDAANITFTSTVGGAHALSASADSGSIGVAGIIGSTTPLASLTLDAKTITLSGIDHAGAAGVSGTVGITASSVITLGSTAYHSGGNQTYTGSVVLAGNETVTSDTGNIGFGGPINGSFALSLFATSGTVSLGDVGTTTKLASLLVDPALILLDGTTYHTAGNQIYSQAVTLGADATLTSDTGNVAFANTIDGAHGLSVTASAGTVTVAGIIGETTALTDLSLNGHSGVTVTSIHTKGAQSYTSASTITLGGLYDTGDGTFTASGPVSLSGPTTLDPGSGSLSVSGALTGSANLTMLGSGGATFASINLDNTGTIDLSGKTAGSFTVNGPTDAAALVTGTNAYSLALLGGGTIGDPTLENSGGDTLAGSFVFPGGLTVPNTLTLGGPTEVNEKTSGITLGTVNQGNNIFIVVADSVSLNGPWNGTGPRGITPFSNLPVSLNDGPNGWVLTNAELQILADTPAFVVIGGGTAITAEILDIVEHNPIFVPVGAPGPINVGTFTFNAPLILIGSSINIDGTFSQTSGGVGFITPGSVAGPGTLDLGPGTGILAVAAGSADLNGTINGTSGGAAANDVVLIVPPGVGTFRVNGACFANCGTGLSTGLIGSLLLFSNELDKSAGGISTGGLEGETGGGGNLPGVSPSGGPGSDQTPTDSAVDALGGPLNSKPPTQAQPRLQGYYVSLLGGMLSVWQALPGTQQGGGNAEENTEFSSEGNGANY